MSDGGWDYALALLVTLGVETPVIAAALRRLGDARPARWAVAAGVNLSSHLAAWLLAYPWLADRGSDAVAFVLVEVAVVAWEAAWLRGWLGRDGPLLAAVVLVANGLSLAAGALV